MLSTFSFTSLIGHWYALHIWASRFVTGLVLLFYLLPSRHVLLFPPLVGERPELPLIFNYFSLSTFVTTDTSNFCSFPFFRLQIFLYLSRALSFITKSPIFLFFFPLSTWRQMPNLTFSSNQKSCLTCIFKYSRFTSFLLMSKFFDCLVVSSLNRKKTNSILI